MGRSFSEGEKKRILRSLKSLATERFAAQGIKGTTVEELTQGVGISKGAFYQFFPSKEELFFSLVEEREQAMREPLLKLDVHDKAAVRDLILSLLVLWKSDPLLRIIADPQEYQVLLRRLPEERLAEHLANDERDLGIYFGRRLAADNPEMGGLLGAAFRGLFLMTLHEKEIGQELLQPVLTFLIEAVLDKVYGNEEKP
jgi:AcrR family transcriptional regulator